MPILDENTLDFVSHSAAQTHRFGVRLGLLLQPGDIVCLEGELGAGKTCLAQGVGEGMGVVEPITSPTFTLIAEYYPPSPAPPLYHIDVFRLDRAVREVMALGLDDYLLGDGVCLIEWADRITQALPDDRLWITLRHLDASKRGLVVSATGTRFRELLRDFRQAAFGM
jgi:tRNA threonylcarbamoyladenosine biosynthesis protein TsaE